MLVRATSASAAIGVRIKEIGRIAYEGEEFEVTDSRYLVLSGQNKYRAVFVVKVTQEEPEYFEEQLPEQEVDEVKPKRSRKKKIEEDD